MSCRPEIEIKFNKWYRQTHMPMLMKFKELKKATMCKILKPEAGCPQYLATYEFEDQKAFKKFETSPELAAALEEMNQTWTEVGYEVAWHAPYEIIDIQQKGS